jgi:hypothetical protein
VIRHFHGWCIALALSGAFASPPPAIDGGARRGDVHSLTLAHP